MYAMCMCSSRLIIDGVVCDMVSREIVFIIRLLTGFVIFFFFNDTATTEIYTLSLHDALPILVFCLGTEGSNG